MLKQLLILASVIFCLGALGLGVLLWRFYPDIVKYNEFRAAENQRIERQRSELEKNPRAFEKARAYHNDRLAGIGSLVRFGDRLLAVTAEHPFEGNKLPTKFLDFEKHPVGELTLGTGVISNNDILAFDIPIQQDAVDIKQALDYFQDFMLVNGERVAIMTSDGMQYAKVDSPSDLSLPHISQVYAKTEKPFKAMGCSGAAVIQISTGNIVGVLATADDGEKATIVGFHLLDLRALKQREAP